MHLLQIVIAGNSISKKNSRQIFKGRSFPSEAYKAWNKYALQQLMINRVPVWSGSYPAELHVFFFRKTKQKFDLSNLVEGVQDVLQEYGIIQDDSMRHIVPVYEKRSYGYGWAVDKLHPRVEIKLKEII